jgi:lambda repressor-like predicted transcriptional regulator
MAANPQPVPEQPRVSTEELRHLYSDEGLSLAKVGKRVGMSPNSVYDRLLKAGCKMRPSKGRAKIEFPIEELRHLYFDEGLTLVEISKRVGLGSNTVEHRLKEAGYKLRPRKVSRIPIETLRHLYFDEELSLEEVGQRVGRNLSAVSSRLRRAGYTLRSGAPAKKEVPSLETVIDDYVNRRVPVAELAKRTGLKPQLIWSRLRDAGVVRPRGHNVAEIWAGRKAKQNAIGGP